MSLKNGRVTKLHFGQTYDIHPIAISQQPRMKTILRYEY